MGGSKTRWAGKPAHCFGCVRRPPIPHPFPEGRGHAHPPPARGRERESSKQKVDQLRAQDRKSRLLAFCCNHGAHHGIRPSRTAQRPPGRAVRLEYVNGRDGQLAKATLTAISNTRRGSGESREEEATAIQWTLWGKQAENAAEYLGKGSHVNIVGRLRNNNYQDADGDDVYALTFTCEEIDYLDSKAEAEARRGEQEPGAGRAGAPAVSPATSSKANGRSRNGRVEPQAADDVPF